MKHKGLPTPSFEDIIIPKNTAAGIYIAAFTFFVGFGFVWHINWLAVVSLVGILVVFILRAFKEDSEYVLPAAEVKKLAIARHTADQVRKKQYLAAAQEPEMSVWDFLRYVINLTVDIIRNRKWKSW